MEIEGTRVLVTGAARGLGRELVNAFLNAGARHVLAGVRKEEQFNQLKAEVTFYELSQRI